jgi:hypothetical protein
MYPNFGDKFHQNAFGAVFANAPSGFAALEVGYLDGTGFQFDAPPADTTGQFSFIGVINPQQNINYSMVRMKAASSYPPTAEAPLADEMILGAAVPLPEPRLVELLGAAGIVVGTVRLLHRARARAQKL